MKNKEHHDCYRRALESNKTVALYSDIVRALPAFCATCKNVGAYYSLDRNQWYICHCAYGDIERRRMLACLEAQTKQSPE